MRNLKLFVTTAALSVALTGCFLDEETKTSSVEFESISVADLIKAGESSKLAGTITSGDAIDTIGMTFTSEGLSESELANITIKNKPSTGTEEIDLSLVEIEAGEEACNADYDFNVYIGSGATTGSAKYSFSVTDGKDCSKTLLTESSVTGAINNVVGKELGAYDLITDVQVKSSDAATTKDLLDISTVADGHAAALASANGAMFVKANDFDYAAATAEDAASVYAAGTAVEKTTAVALGDIYIVKLAADRGVEYVVLKITKVDASVGTSTTNTGVVEFSYKK